MLFDDVDTYYQPEDGRYWQQGDIVLAPSAVFENGQVLRLLQAPPEAGGGTERPGI